jgi:Plavaka transposase
MFHLSPYKLFRRHPNIKASERIFSEMYDSDVFLDEHDKVQRAPTDDPTCKRERVIAALMFWSDATHLATFGTAKLWPIYMLFGNLSKYVRCQPNSGATRHLAYIPPFPDSLQDQLKAFHQKWDTQQKDILAHCRRELMHGVWKFLLDDDFIHAYYYGMVVQCHDSIERRIYPRIFTYSADYPEKCVNHSLFLSAFHLTDPSPSLAEYYLLPFAIKDFVHVRDAWYQNQS